MKNLFDSARVAEITTRINALRPDSPRQWGRMTAPQAVAHLSIGLEAALGDRQVPRLFIGRLIGGFVKKVALCNDNPIAKNAPTAPSYIVADERYLGRERAKLLALVNRFASGGPAVCTKEPHAFFGTLTPDEWAVLMYKHLDHHLRQFNA